MEPEYESVLLVKNEIFVFKIPPRTTNRAYRAADWNLEKPDWTGRMRLVTQGMKCTLKLEDKVTGELFAKCPIDQYPGIAIEAVSDSSRYFVIRIQDDSGRAAFIGIGFSDRSDSFDLNVALQDHFKWLKKSEEIEKDTVVEDQAKPHLDLSFKDGQTIKINMKIGKKDGSEGVSRPKPKAATSGGLPPPPGGFRIAPPPAPGATAKFPLQSSDSNMSYSSRTPSSNLLSRFAAPLLDLGMSGGATAQPQQVPDMWGEFTSATPGQSQSAAK
nr:EOG090X0G5X [Eulimnadia texana]